MMTSPPLALEETNRQWHTNLTLIGSCNSQANLKQPPTWISPKPPSVRKAEVKHSLVEHRAFRSFGFSTLLVGRAAASHYLLQKPPTKWLSLKPPGLCVSPPRDSYASGIIMIRCRGVECPEYVVGPESAEKGRLHYDRAG